MRSILSVSVVVLLMSGCGGDDPGLKKKVDQLERRVESLERVGGKKGEKGKHAKADAKKEGEGAQAAAGAAVDESAPKGKVEVSGDATKVALLRNGSRFEVPGNVPAGAYQVVARFGDQKVEAGPLEVAAGQTTTVLCTAAEKKCAKQ